MKIDFNIKKPYAKYLAFKTLQCNITDVFEGLQVENKINGVFGISWTKEAVLLRIDSIMHDCEYYKRGNNHEKFDCNYHWHILPSRETPHKIDIYSITGKEVGTITIKEE